MRHEYEIKKVIIKPKRKSRDGKKREEELETNIRSRSLKQQ